MIINRIATMHFAIMISLMFVNIQLGISQAQSSTLSHEQREALFDYDKTTGLGIKVVGPTLKLWRKR